jgi:hypothetical protein
MERIIELFTSIIEFISNIKELFLTTNEKGNLPNWLISEVTFYILLVGICISIYKFIFSLLKKFFAWRNKRILNKDLSYSSFSKNDVEKATKYYIPSKYQNISPSDDEEPGSKYIASAKNELIPLFIKKVFSINGDDNKYYLILADAGMGKTTFMINLYLKYKNQKKMFWSAPNKEILLYSLGDKKTLENISTISNKQ